MNDFFTELDADLVTTDISPITPVIATIPKPVVKPTFHPPLPKKQPPQNPEKNNPVQRVTEIRSQMMQAGVIVVVFKADEKSKALLGHLKIETRGFAFPDEVREAHKVIIKKARASYEDTVKDIPDIEEKDLIKIIRRDLEAFLLNKFERSPVIIPVVMYV